MKKTLLIVEDNLILCDILERWLQKAGYRVLTAIDEPSARRKIKGNNVALVLTDVRLPEGDGISLLEWSISQGLHIPFVVMTEHASIADAVRAVKLGAKDYLPKPVHEELLMELLRGLIGLPVSVPPKKSLMKRLSGAVRETERIACRVAPLNCSVMILGPNGSGKESVAQLIQQHSGRKDKPFVAVNCGCIRGELAASEFFGHVQGAFTDAKKDTAGYFETAKGGTLFLDEIGNMPPEMQTLLLRVLQERVYCPVGSREPFLHKDLVKMVAYAYRKGMRVAVYTSGIYNDSKGYSAIPIKHLMELLPYSCKIIVNYEASTPETYDTIMGTKVEGWRLLHETILHCVRMGLEIEAHTVPMPINYRQIPDIIMQCSALGIKKVSFLRLVFQGRAKDNERLTLLSEEQQNEAKAIIYKMREQLPNHIRIGIPLSDCSGSVNCLAGTTKLNVRYDGNVYPCEAFKDDANNESFTHTPQNVYNNRLIDIYQNSAFLVEVRKSLEEYHSVCNKEKCFNQYLRKYGKY